MNRQLNLGLSLAAGLLGGLLSHYSSVKPLLAQYPTASAKELSAQAFILVNDKGVPFGLFGFDAEGNAIIRLQDRSGKVIWSTKASPRPLAISR